MPVLQMKRSDALSWVKKAIENERYSTAVEIINSLIEQEKGYEKIEQEKG